jgi:D-glycero-alpha-D-manno-heptose-7-phosphate kinase
MIETMHKIPGYGIRAGDITRFGQLLDAHWQTKKNLSNNVSNDRIDALHETAKLNGTIGGKECVAAAEFSSCSTWKMREPRPVR